MKKFLTGFLIGGIVSSAITLLTTKTSGKENREYAKQMIYQGKELIENISITQEQVEFFKQQAIPFVQQSIHSIQSSIVTFSYENQPRIKRINEKMTTLQQHVEELTANKE